MVTKRSDSAGQKQAKGRFQPGRSGNPAGRPKGARHRVTIAVEALLEGEADKLTRKAVELALNGDTTALRLCLERIAPPARERAVNVDLPALEGAGDLPALMASILAAVAKGEITPSEGQAVAGVAERWRAAVETSEIEERLRVLEDRAGVGPAS